MITFIKTKIGKINRLDENSLIKLIRPDIITPFIKISSQYPFFLYQGS